MSAISPNVSPGPSVPRFLPRTLTDTVPSLRTNRRRLLFRPSAAIVSPGWKLSSWNQVARRPSSRLFMSENSGTRCRRSSGAAIDVHPRAGREALPRDADPVRLGGRVGVEVLDAATRDEHAVADVAA